MSFHDDDRAMMTAAGMLPLAEPPPESEASRRWPRRVLVALWLLVFVGAGTALARSWDRILDDLTGRPAPTTLLPAQGAAPGGQGPR